jgi:mRNA-degrading endonuclease RelE of RelBE toxin-antitoxin system
MKIEQNDDNSLDSLILPAPEPNATGSRVWKLVAYNKRVLKSWKSLCNNTLENARDCYNWLTAHATEPIPRRCYALKGKANAGCWGYEIGSGNRVYYKPDETTSTAVIYYAGPHPPKVPDPPDGL